MFRYYAKFITGAQDHANSLIEDSMGRWDARLEAETPQSKPVWTGNGPEQMVRGGIPVGDIGRTSSNLPRRR